MPSLLHPVSVDDGGRSSVSADFPSSSGQQEQMTSGSNGIGIPTKTEASVGQTMEPPSSSKEAISVATAAAAAESDMKIHHQSDSMTKEDNTNDENKESELSASAAATAAADHGKKVTPSDDEAKPAQQKKVQQLSLAAFFMPSSSSSSRTPSSSSKARSSSTSSSLKKRKHDSTTTTGSGKNTATSSKKTATSKQLPADTTSPIRPRRTDDSNSDCDGDVDMTKNISDGQEEEKDEPKDHSTGEEATTGTTSAVDARTTTEKTTAIDSFTGTETNSAPRETIVGLAKVLRASGMSAVAGTAAGTVDDGGDDGLDSKIDAAISQAVTETISNGLVPSSGSNKKTKSKPKSKSKSNPKSPPPASNNKSIDAFLQPVSSIPKPKNKAAPKKNQGASSDNKKSGGKASAGAPDGGKSNGASSTSNKKKAVEAPSPIPIDSLSDEKKSHHEKYTTMKDKHTQRATEIVEKNRDGLVVENYDRAPLEEKSLVDGDNSNNDGGEDFPTVVTTNMCILIEGSKLPLSLLVKQVSSELTKAHGKEWSVGSIEEKIKLLAQRKAYFEELPQNVSKTAVNLYEDTTVDRLWRWEVTTLDILPLDTVGPARKARSALKKVSYHHSAILKLIKSTNDILDKIVDPRAPKLDGFIAKISQNEERVLKYEREAEKQRLAEEAKARKAQEQEAKKRAKEAADEEARRKKEEAAEAAREAKRKKEEEKEQQEAEKKLAEEKKQKRLNMQKSSFMSFFGAPKKTTAEKSDVKTPNASSKDIDVNFDCQKFRAHINNSSSADVDVSLKATFKSTKRIKRKRGTEKVPVTILTTVQPEEEEVGWDVPTYSEKKTIKVRNKYIFLSFHEDCRPPYHGTWNKQSSIVSGRTPFRKDTSFFDYDYDSEAEWEEGDDEVGEDVEDEGKDLEEEADDPVAKMYDYDDGFCVADEQFLENEEDADDEAKAMYKKKLQKDDHRADVDMNQLRIIAPAMGGIPLSEGSAANGCVEGFGAEIVPSVLASYETQTLSELKLYLDAFPQLDIEVEQSPEAENAAGTNTSGPSSNKDEYSAEYISTFARFTHHSTLSSKEKLVEELCSSNPILFDNKAKATRKLDAIAVKKKHPSLSGTTYWEINRDVLVEHGLTDVLDRQLEVPPVEPSKSEGETGKSETKRKTQKKSSGDDDTEAPPKKKSKKSKKAPASADEQNDSSAPPKKKSKKSQKAPAVAAADEQEQKTEKSPPCPNKSQSLMMAFLKKGKPSDTTDSSKDEKPTSQPNEGAKTSSA